MTADETLSCMLSDAPAACNYWAEYRNFKSMTTSTDVASFQVRENGHENAPTRSPNSWRTINAAALRKGAEMLRDGRVSVARRVAAAFCGKIEDWEYDHESLDCAVQAFVFGKVVYG